MDKSFIFNSTRLRREWLVVAENSTVSLRMIDAHAVTIPTTPFILDRIGTAL
jgi:hypothetical protein